MEKTTKKKKKSKGLRKRIGIIAIGGLSLVLTICLSVGATLAWFAGSSWSSSQLYMGGPVYVEMAGRGNAGGTNANGTHSDGDSNAAWKGGAGNLDIKAATARTTGTSTNDYTKYPDGGTRENIDSISDNILLPGQKFEIYSQARVFSTAYTSSIGTNVETSTSSGANTTNTSKSGTSHITDKGRITSTTTSVLRARFSISVEFDPTVGFNNFTDSGYSSNYPEQSKVFNGANQAGSTDLAWADALGKQSYKISGSTFPAGSRRDAVTNEPAEGESLAPFTSGLTKDTGLEKVKAGTQKSIFKWKFVSQSVYGNRDITAESPSSANATFAKTFTYAKMGAPFDGQTKINGIGFYGVWILTDNANKTGDDDAKVLAESDAFYKARCNSYIDSYVEEYITEYGEKKTRTIGESLASLENSLNQEFVKLINDSSDNIINGFVGGMQVTNGVMSAQKPASWVSGTTDASWLYIDPTIGNDTNTNELATGTGGWWYLVACDSQPVKLTGTTSKNQVYLTKDSATFTESGGTKIWNDENQNNAVNAVNGVSSFTRTTEGFTAKDDARLDAKLYEINPLIDLPEALGTNDTTKLNDITKVVSYAFPFVNGTSALPGDALTNVFANAKITIQISFQALQAFFPFSANIDSMDYTNKLLGTAKVLSIRNAIPIYNEAFDYQENVSVKSIAGL